MCVRQKKKSVPPMRASEGGKAPSHLQGLERNSASKTHFKEKLIISFQIFLYLYHFWDDFHLIHIFCRCWGWLKYLFLHVYNGLQVIKVVLIWSIQLSDGLPVIMLRCRLMKHRDRGMEICISVYQPCCSINHVVFITVLVSVLSQAISVIFIILIITTLNLGWISL